MSPSQVMPELGSSGVQVSSHEVQHLSFCPLPGSFSSPWHFLTVPVQVPSLRNVIMISDENLPGTVRSWLHSTNTLLHYCSASQFITLHCIALLCSALHFTSLLCTLLHCTALHLVQVPRRDAARGLQLHQAGGGAGLQDTDGRPM